MKSFLLFLILNSVFNILNLSAQSPDWLWAKGIGGTNGDEGLSIAIDPVNEDVYTTGWFEGTVDFNPGAGVFNLTSAGNNDIFISKLDSLGNFVWAIQMGGTSWDVGESIAIDPAGSGNVYTTGAFYGTADFDPGPGVFNLTSDSNGYGDIFISKLDSSGNFVWAKSMGGIGEDGGWSIAIDPAGSGDIYTTGYFVATADFDPDSSGSFNLSSSGFEDIFISKLDSSGNFVWAKRMGGTFQDHSESIAIDPAGSGAVYTTGAFTTSAADFDPGAGIFNLTSVGGNDIFISKLDASGNFVWAKAMGGTNVDWAESIAIDPGGNGDVYTTGYFSGTADFDPGVGVFDLIATGGILGELFISKLDSSGNFVWAKRIGGAENEGGASIAIDPSGSGDVYTTGYFRGIVDFDPDTTAGNVFNLISAGDHDIFISKLDNAGNFGWAKSASGIGNDYGNSMAIGTSGHVYVTGYYNSPSIVFGSSTLTHAGNGDLFIARLDTAVVTGINAIENFKSGISLFPNPFSNSTTISFSLSQSQKVSLKIFDVSGRLVSILADKIFETGENEIVWNAAEVNAGIYFLQFQTTEFISSEKLIVTK